MRTFMVAMVSGLAALVGLAGVANANETLRLEWQGTGGQNFIISPGATVLVLDIIIIPDAGDTNGTLGGEISIDYTEGGTKSLLSFVSPCANNATDFPIPLIGEFDNGIAVTGVGQSTFTVETCLQTPCLLSSCSFFNTPSVTENLTVSSFCSPGEGVNELPCANFPVGFGTAVIVNTPEPGALAMLGLGFGGLILGRNRKS